MRFAAQAAEIAGFALLVVGAFIVSAALGFAVAGVGLIAWSLATDRGGPPPREEAP